MSAKPRRACIDGGSARRHLIATGALREGTGAALTRSASTVAAPWRLDDASHHSAAVEIWCCERERAADLLRHHHARVAPSLVAEIDRLAIYESAGFPVTFTPREQWLREAMAPESDLQPEALAS